ncbi:PhzF family phenazine biosynthesis protein [Streptomyces beigongshangae]|uniref:PhzF family phenazine biosynthesis protein n=1 Tax=Streptomyces beigongshangae TaxID=2841597 RepID=UPI001C843583|nr:PhzF family phenazine biosynthesis isomerase [Streptomyces sp. REN17]
MNPTSNGEFRMLNGTPYGVVDACVSGSLQGNPAAVVQLDHELPDSTLLRLAQLLDEPVTAFLTQRAGSNSYRLRWFTRNCELRICGHATLAASAWLLGRLGDGMTAEWHTQAGVLTADQADGKVRVSFPETPLHSMDSERTRQLAAALGMQPKECYVAGDDYLAVLDTGEKVMDFKPDIAAIERLACRGVIVTAEYPSMTGEELDYDIVSRMFAPRIAIPEDEVCVSAHLALYPFWTQRLARQKLKALQPSPRGGALELESRTRGRVSVTSECRVNTSAIWGMDLDSSAV